MAIHETLQVRSAKQEVRQPDDGPLLNIQTSWKRIPIGTATKHENP